MLCKALFQKKINKNWNETATGLSVFEWNGSCAIAWPITYFYGPWKLQLTWLRLLFWLFKQWPKWITHFSTKNSNINVNMEQNNWTELFASVRNYFIANLLRNKTILHYKMTNFSAWEHKRINYTIPLWIPLQVFLQQKYVTNYILVIYDTRDDNGPILNGREKFGRTHNFVSRISRELSLSHLSQRQFIFIFMVYTQSMHGLHGDAYGI